jgi:hypothetical protein
MLKEKLKFKDILNKKVIYEENLGDEYYWDYRIIVQIDKENIVLIEYDDSLSGYISFKVESVDKEFISSFFGNYVGKIRKIKLNFDSTSTLKETIDFEYDKEYLEYEIVVLKMEDIKEYIEEE